MFYYFVYSDFMFIFAASKHKVIMMNTVTILPTSPDSARYWSELKDLSNGVKLELITLLSSSVANSVSEQTEHKGWTKSFAGRWQDDRSAEEIMEDIRVSRNAKIKEVVL